MWFETTKVFSSTKLPNLSEGNHNVTIYYGYQEHYRNSPARYLVFAQSTEAFAVVNSNSTNVNTPNSDLNAYTKPEISINSPSGNITTNSTSFPLNFSVNFTRSSVSTALSIYYLLDGKDNTTLFNNGISYIDGSVFTFSNHTISNLSDGIHNVTIQAKAYYLYIGSGSEESTVQITVDTMSPAITDLSIENKTYSGSSIPLKFQTSENTPWIAYNLDNQGNTTIQGNVTLSKLTNGTHSIIIYAYDAAGNSGASQTTFFTVTPSQNPTPISGIGTVIAILAAVVVVGVGVLLFRRHRKASKSESETV